MIIYQIICKANQKSYVGLTSRTLQQRWDEHIANALKNVHTPFYCAIRAHGVELFEPNVVETCDTWEEACLAERRLIVELQSHITANGYNATLGGEGVYGYVYTPEQKERKSNAARNSQFVKRQPVCQIDAMGNLIACFRTTEEAMISTGVKHIGYVLNGTRNSAGGYFWCKPDDLHEFVQKIATRPAPFRTFEVEQCSLNGELINSFSTIADAQRATGIRHIYEASVGQIKSAGGFTWRRR